jgi:hypothetical protein
MVEANRWAIESALKDASTYRAAAALLNDRGVATQTGGPWYAASVQHIALRLVPSFDQRMSAELICPQQRGAPPTA